MVERLDLVGRALTGGEARWMSGLITTGGLVQVEMLSGEGVAELAEGLVELHREHLPAGEDSYSQILVGRGGAIFNWGTSAGEGAVWLELGRLPSLERVASSAVALAEALGAEGEGEPLISMVPSLRRTRTFPRFFHRDSHTSVSEIDREGTALAASSCYRSVWDLGLENSSDVLDVAFVRREELLADDGSVAACWRPLFQQQDLDFRAMSDEEIDAVQPQMREELLPPARSGVDADGERPRLLPGRAFVWHDDRWFHSTYLRAGRALSELAERPRSILVVREFAPGAHRDIPWSAVVRRLLPAVLAG